MASLIDQVASRNNLYFAWSSISHRPSSRGSDQQTISDFADDLFQHLKTIGRAVRNSTYEFEPLLAHALNKPDGGKRIIRIPSVKDRVVQKAIQLIIEPRLEKRYRLNNDVSFAYLRNKSVRKAVKRVRDLYLAGFEWVHFADLEDFFGTIPPQRLVEDYVAPVIKSDRLCQLIREALKCDVSNLEDMRRLGLYDKCIPQDAGIAQGIILSPLFSNLYLNKLDRAMIDSNFEMVRYADDFIVMCRSEQEAVAAEKLTRSLVTDELGLRLHPLGSSKSKIEPFETIEFLGVKFVRESVYPGTKRLERLRKLLGDFQKRPLRKSFLDNLSFLRDVTASWASDFYCMEVEPDTYRELDNSLLFALVKLFRAHNFVPRKSPLPLKQLENLGIRTFTKRVNEMRSNKLREYGDFYGIGS